MDQTNIMATKLSSALSGFNVLFHQLWLSISSVNFYHNVYKIYKGYGIKYLFTVSFISSVIQCLFMLHSLVSIKNYCITNKSSKSSASFEYIFKQLPNIYYDGSIISLKEDGPLYLYDKNNNKIAVIDSKNQLSHSEKAKVPILFSSNRVTMAIAGTAKKTHMEYSMLFGFNQQILTQEIIKKHCADILAKASTIFIYIMMPIIVVVHFIIILFETSVIVMLVYLLTYFYGPKLNLQTCIRMVLFSSGVVILLQPIIVLLELNNIKFFIQMFTSYLLLLGLLQIRNER